MCLESLSEAVTTSKCAILLFNHIIVSLMIYNQYRKFEEVVEIANNKYNGDEKEL